MPWTGSPLPESSDTWKYALVGGVLSIPFTAVGYWRTGSEMSLTPVLLGGFVAAYLAERRTGESTGVGVRAGLVGGVPVLWLLADVLAATSGLAGPPWFRVTGTVFVVVLVPGLAVFGFGLAALGGWVGGRIGGWLARSGGRDRRPGARS